MKQITIKYNGNTYVLEFNRRTIKWLESRDFDINQLGKATNIVTTLSIFVHAAFIMHNPKISEDEALEVFESISNKDDFITKLIDLYDEPLSALMDDAQEGKANWEVNW